jgi:hypothetical protein
MIQRCLVAGAQIAGASAALIAAAQGYGMAALSGLAIVLLAINVRGRPKRSDAADDATPAQTRQGAACASSAELPSQPLCAQPGGASRPA